MRKHDVCTITDCGKPHESQGFCPAHYRRFRLYGDPLGKAVRQYELPCRAEGCDRRRRANGWCGLHLQRIAAHGDETKVAYATAKQTVCSIPGCEERHQAKGMCGKHYRRWRVNGDPSIIGRPHGSRTRKDGYVSVYVPGHPMASPQGNVLEHRLVMSEMLGRPLAARENVHHRNGIRTDNRPENLELWLRPQPAGQRVSDLLDYAVGHFGDELRARLTSEAEMPSA